jgi:tRNA dimethylallyltransferase
MLYDRILAKMNQTHLPIILLMGPTAAGKTAIAFELYKRLPIELISVDSALVYRDMNIGTAKPSYELLRQFPHALVDIRDPDEAYSVAQFCADAKKEIERALERGRIPVLVGGTMLYYSGLIRGLNELPTTNESVRQKIAQEAQVQGWVAMHQRLTVIDPTAALRIHPNDPQRIGRALEVFEMTGRTLTDWWQNSEKERFPWPVLSIAMAPTSREILHKNIEQRFMMMLEAGFIEEVEALKARPQMHADLPSMRAVGYRQVWDYLENNHDHATMITKGIIATRQLAKRQMTWLRQWPDLNWFDSLQTQVADNVYEFIMTNLNKSSSKTCS